MIEPFFGSLFVPVNKAIDVSFDLQFLHGWYNKNKGEMLGGCMILWFKVEELNLL